VQALLYADDIVLLAASAAALDRMLAVLMCTLREWGLIVNVPKTKRMVICPAPAGPRGAPRPPAPDAAPAPAADAALAVESVDAFKYLGVLTTADGALHRELNARKALAAGKFNSMFKRVWRVSTYSERLKGEFYKAYVLSILLYGCEVWAISKAQMQVLSVFHHGCLRRLLGISLSAQVPLQAIFERTGTEPIADLVRQRRLAMLGRAQRAGEGRCIYHMLYASGLHGSRPHGRNDIMTHYIDDLRATGLLHDFDVACQGRDAWKELVKARTTGHRPGNV
jgi:hypothetical protein